ncbi:MAG: hypothetical protein P8182_09995 [Deltaproteobacteria bacterium]
MTQSRMAEQIVSEMERVTPYMYEGLYGSFLRKYMKSDKSTWTSDLSTYLGNVNREWEDLSTEIADVLWERFEKRISC